VLHVFGLGLGVLLSLVCANATFSKRKFTDQDFIFQKIADFGLATEVKSEQKQFTMCGTPNYMAP